MIYPDEKIANQIIPNLWIGNYHSSTNDKFIKDNNIKYIINLTQEYPSRFKNITYLNIPINYKTISSRKSNKLYKFTNKFISNSLKKNTGVLVHCKSGHHRSASVIAAYLIKYLGCDPVKVIKHIRERRPYSLIRYSNMIDALI